MSRARRSHLPGAVFHLTARTQGHEPYFSGTLRSRIVEYMATAVLRTDVRLLAYAVMPNHLHLVIRQGDRPLSFLMQPLLRSTALLVQRSRGVEGHVFERKFGDRPCLDPEHARNAIVYTHLNPVRAGIVADPDAYTWSSHARYMTRTAGPMCMIPALAPEATLGLFAARDGAGIVELRRAYRRYVDWRRQCDERVSVDDLEVPGPLSAPPFALAGDRFWSRTMSARWSHGSYSEGLGVTGGTWTPVSDLEVIARSVLDERTPHMSLATLRSGSKAPQVVAARRAAIVRMSAAGHNGETIAGYLRVTGACVSLAVVAARNAALR